MSFLYLMIINSYKPTKKNFALKYIQKKEEKQSTHIKLFEHYT